MHGDVDLAGRNANVVERCRSCSGSQARRAVEAAHMGLFFSDADRTEQAEQLRAMPVSSEAKVPNVRRWSSIRVRSVGARNVRKSRR